MAHRIPQEGSAQASHSDEAHQHDLATAVALLRQPAIGPRALEALLHTAAAHGITLAECAGMPPEALAGRVPSAVAAAVAAAALPADRTREHEQLERLRQRGGDAYLVTHAGYPATFRELPQPPPWVTLNGNRGLVESPLSCEALDGTLGLGAVVGARRIDARAHAVAHLSAAVLTEVGPVVSGGAIGTDAVAHETALGTAHGETILVAPEGLNRIRPDAVVSEGLENGRALLVSVEVPDARWATPQALGRNRLIAAMARVVVVIEPRRTGGSVHTARAALGMGRRVFVWAVEACDGTVAALIAAGAAPLVDTEGVMRVEALAEALTTPLHPPPSTAEPGLFDRE